MSYWKITTFYSFSAGFKNKKNLRFVKQTYIKVTTLSNRIKQAQTYL